MNRFPEPEEYADFYKPYIQELKDGEVISHLQNQMEVWTRDLAALEEEIAGFTYGPGKWTVREVLQHLIDSERVFSYRALCIARGEKAELPGFDENSYIRRSHAARRNLAEIIAEYQAVRTSTLFLYLSFDPEVWSNMGKANGSSISVSALAFITAGHELHHLRVLRDKYSLKINI